MARASQIVQSYINLIALNEPEVRSFADFFPVPVLDLLSAEVLEALDADATDDLLFCHCEYRQHEIVIT